MCEVNGGYARHYDPKERQVMALDGRVLAYLTNEAIVEAFNIPRYNSTIYKMEEVLRIYNNGLDSCAEIFNNTWMLKPRKNHSKLPKSLVRSNFKEEYGDLVTLSNQVIGCPQASILEPWMLYFIQEIVTKVKMINWAKLISVNLDEQLGNL